MNQITIEELLKKNRGIIIDIRSRLAYSKSHIPGAISIPEAELFFHPEEYLSYDEVYYVYCSSGVRSRLLVSHLNSRGYHTIHVVGGFHDYLYFH